MSSRVRVAELYKTFPQLIPLQNYNLHFYKLFLAYLINVY